VIDFAPLLASQRRYFETGSTRSIGFRQEQLKRLGAGIESHEEALFSALRADLRKSPQEAYTSEIGVVLSEVAHAIRHLPKWARNDRRKLPVFAKPGRGWVAPEPRGLVLIIGPWNFPVQLLLTPLAGAIAAGNCACLKMSEHAPRTSSAVAEMIRAVFPEEYVCVVEGPKEAAEALIQLKFDHIFFTGSAPVGKAVMRAAAENLTPVTLELGGKCPCLVCDDATPEVAARRILWGKFINAGQACVAPDFLLVDKRITERLMEEMIKALHRFYGDDPRQSPDYGRIIDRRHFDRLVAFLNDGKAVTGGTHDARELYIAPTILTGVKRSAPVMQEEIFGPILPVIEYDNLDEALAWLGGLPSPLALYLFSNKRELQDRVIAKTRSGSVCINDTVLQITAKHLPFGGTGESGFGSYHGKAGFDCFSHARAILKRPEVFDPAGRYPPVDTLMKDLRRIYRYLIHE
jgi:aldehyde dehydrogenase (NAD+)